MLETPRLKLRLLTTDDAEFIIELVNEPAFIENIGDKKVSNKEEAINYINAGPLAMYHQYGYCLYLIEENGTSEPVGICGLLKRDYLDAPDVGYALLERHWGKGLISEALEYIVPFELKQHGLSSILAITSPENERSISVLLKQGFEFIEKIVTPDNNKETNLYSLSA